MRAGKAGLALLGLGVCVVAVRWTARDFVTDDVTLWVLPWMERLDTQGWAALGKPMPTPSWAHGKGAYTPPYYYYLLASSPLDGVLSPLHRVKLVSLVFELLAALAVGLIVKRTTASSRHAVLAGFALLLAPTVVANGPLWGQADSTIGAFAMWTLYFAVAKRPIWTMAAFGIALATKATAIFMTPVLLLLLLRGDLSIRTLWVLPATIALVLLPSALAGRPWSELLGTYLNQGGLYHGLSMNAPNLYEFVPNHFYRGRFLKGGILVTVAACAFIAVAGARANPKLQGGSLLLFSTLGLAMCPFLLPKMHDRYFYCADLASIALAFSCPKWWYIAAGFQLSSGLAYVPIIAWSISPTLLTEAQMHAAVSAGAIVNTVLVARLSYLAWQTLGSPGLRQLISLPARGNAGDSHG